MSPTTIEGNLPNIVLLFRVPGLFLISRVWILILNLVIGKLLFGYIYQFSPFSIFTFCVICCDWKCVMEVLA